ncbi:hypothetical protein GGG16DRAFT_117825 [Schizophyllum commune]
MPDNAKLGVQYSEVAPGIDFENAMKMIALKNGPSFPKADEYLRTRNFARARELCMRSVRNLMGDEVPGEGPVMVKAYMKAHPAILVELMGCYNRIARAYWEQNKDRNSAVALDWCNEAWKDWHIMVPELIVQYCVTLDFMSQIFLHLGNTGSAMSMLTRGIRETVQIKGDFRQRADWKEATNIQKQLKLARLRHPDPVVRPTRVIDPSLQVYGSWTRLHAKRPVKKEILERQGHTCFIWNGRMYLAGGRNAVFAFFRDLWYVDLNAQDLAWRRLPDYPAPVEETNMFWNWTMVVHADKAYVINGQKQVDYFDLVTEKWGRLQCTYEPKSSTERGWPWPGFAQDAAVVVVQGKIYVFAGTHVNTNLGCNLFMELDIEAKRWRRLGGTANDRVDASDDIPGPRKRPIAFADPDGHRFWMMYGHADRQATPEDHPHHVSGDDAFQYEDAWTYDVDTGKWTKERIPGNAPAPRTEAGSAYDPTTGQAIVFGGYHPQLMTYVPEMNVCFNFCYFADSFVCSLSPTPRWRQVLTAGFPTYRAQPTICADPDTGALYMFGGFANSDYVPVRGNMWSRTYGDLWKLVIAPPGKDLEGVNVEEEARTARAGPWQRCFTCGAAGQWRKCGGEALFA